MKHLRPLRSAALPALLIAALPCAARAQSYTITALPLLPGGDEAVAYDINNAGVITGDAVYSAQHRYNRAVRWSGGTVTALALLSGGNRAHGFSITDTGLIAGAAEVGAGFSSISRGMRVPSGGTTIELPGTLRSQAVAANAAGQIVGSNGNGQVIPGIGVPHTVVAIWSPPGYTVQNLGSLGGPYAEGTSINDLGLIVGRSLLLNGPMHAFSKSPQGPLVDLGTLGGRASEAYSVNNAGRIVGWADLPSGARHAVMWEGTVITDLGTLPGAASSEAHAVNAGGEIAGTSWVAGQGPRAWVLRPGGMANLNDLIPAGSGWVLQYARGINDKGQIVGQGRLNGKTRAFLLDPDGGCYANCDGSTSPVLSIADFACFQTKFVAGDPYADCTQSNGLTIADFSCFQASFVAGCP